MTDVDEVAVERLVAAAKHGDAMAFGRIFDIYHGPVHRYIVARTHNPADAEDLTQLVFLKALEALPRYEARGIPFGGWLFRLARNAVIDHARTHREHADLDATVERSGNDPELGAHVVAGEEIEAVGQALAALTDEQREAIALRFFAGLSARETATAMGKQEGTVRGLQFRAIAALRRHLGLDAGDAEDRRR
jgi:RNA polymerase sigma-70 factor (ECF subfamily)